MPGAGQLRERVAFEQRADVPDGYGNHVAGPWQERFRMDAEIKPLRGGETVLAARLSGTQPVIIVVRQCLQTRSVTTEWRVRDVRTNTIYNIRGISDTEGRRKYFDMVCEAGVAT